MASQRNTFAKLVQGWVSQSFQTRPTFVRRRRPDGEFEASAHAPRGSKARNLVISTWRGDLWVRFGPPNLFYSVDSRKELAFVVRQLLSERALFVVRYRDGEWTGTTLVTRGTSPKLVRGEVAHVVSWTGRFDRTIELGSEGGTRSKSAAMRPDKRLHQTAAAGKVVVGRKSSGRPLRVSRDRYAAQDTL